MRFQLLSLALFALASAEGRYAHGIEDSQPPAAVAAVASAHQHQAYQFARRQVPGNSTMTTTTSAPPTITDAPPTTTGRNNTSSTTKFTMTSTDSNGDVLTLTSTRVVPPASTDNPDVSETTTTAPGLQTDAAIALGMGGVVEIAAIAGAAAFGAWVL